MMMIVGQVTSNDAGTVHRAYVAVEDCNCNQHTHDVRWYSATIACCGERIAKVDGEEPPVWSDGPNGQLGDKTVQCRQCGAIHSLWIDPENGRPRK